MSAQERPTAAQLTDDQLRCIALAHWETRPPDDVRREILRRDLNPVTSRTWELVLQWEDDETEVYLIHPAHEDRENLLLTAGHAAGDEDPLRKPVGHEIDEDLRRITVRLAP